MAKLPTNADIIEEVGALKADVGKLKEWVKATHDLAVKTNGRVTELEKQSIAHNAVTAYKEGLNRNKQWVWIVFVTVIAPLVGVIAAKVVK